MRGQAHTMEAILGGLVLLGGLLFALQVTAVTPLSASTSNQYIENQQSGIARGVLAVTSEEGGVGVESPLKRAVLFWGDENSDGIREFHCSDGVEVYYTKPPSASCPASPSVAPPNEFGVVLDRAFGPGTAVNVQLFYRTPAGFTESQWMVYQGDPTDNAVQVTTLVTLHDDDVVYDSSENPTGMTVGSGAADFYAPDAFPSTGTYNVIEVEVTVWRI
ncbi:MAG: hypothetical protein ABEJ22_07270 [Haloferacaceae archaeon]